MAGAGVMKTLDTVPYVPKAISVAIGVYLTVLSLSILDIAKTDGYPLFDKPRRVLSAKPLKFTFLILFVCAGCVGLYISALETDII